VLLAQQQKGQSLKSDFLSLPTPSRLELDMNAHKTCWCGNDQLKEFSPEYLECSKCGTLVSCEGLGVEDTQVKNDDVDFYGKEYWLSHQTEHYGFPDIYQRARQDLVERCIYWLHTLLDYKLPPATVLELGCSHGGSVALLHWAGFRASGLEMSPWVVEFAHKTFNIPMLLGRVEDQQIEAESLDAIVLYDVLEHLPEPLDTLGYCASLLKPDGILIVQIPSFEEGKLYLDMVKQNDSFLELMQPIEHLHLFSRRAAQQFFERLSFNYLEFKPALFAYDMYLVASREPLVKRSPEEIEASLLASTSGRLVQALLDQTATLQQLQASHQELVAFYQASESDRADRLQVIENQGQDLVKLSSAIHHTQMVMNQYRTQLDSALEQLHRVDSELQQAYVHLEYSQAQLADSKTQLQFQQNELTQTQIQLKKSQTVVERKDFRLKNLKAKLESSQLEIRTMKSSKFWKLRDQWIKLKARFDSTAVSGK